MGQLRFDIVLHVMKTSFHQYEEHMIVHNEVMVDLLHVA